MLTVVALALFTFSDLSKGIIAGLWASESVTWIVVAMLAAFRRGKMQKAGTWQGFGSIVCENKWNGGKGKKQKGMLASACIGEDDPEYATFLGLKWVELPQDRRVQIFRHNNPWRGWSKNRLPK
jgi:hypothetical protein